MGEREGEKKRKVESLKGRCVCGRVACGGGNNTNDKSTVRFLVVGPEHGIKGLYGPTLQKLDEGYRMEDILISKYIQFS